MKGSLNMRTRIFWAMLAALLNINLCFAADLDPKLKQFESSRMDVIKKVAPAVVAVVTGAVQAFSLVLMVLHLPTSMWLLAKALLLNAAFKMASFTMLFLSGSIKLAMLHSSNFFPRNQTNLSLQNLPTATKFK